MPGLHEQRPGCKSARCAHQECGDRAAPWSRTGAQWEGMIARSGALDAVASSLIVGQLQSHARDLVQAKERRILIHAGTEVVDARGSSLEIEVGSRGEDS